MSHLDMPKGPLTQADLKAVIGHDYRPLRESVVHPYDPDFFTSHCLGEHQGYVLHEFGVDHVPEIFELVTADEAEDIDDHFFGTFTDDYETAGNLFNTIANPSLVIDGINRYVICGPDHSLVGRLDEMPLMGAASPETEVTLWIADPFRQQNIGSYILNRFTGDLFHEREGLSIVRANAWVGSIGARKLLEQAGFEKTGLVYEDDEEPFQTYVLNRPTES